MRYSIVLPLLLTACPSAAEGEPKASPAPASAPADALPPVDAQALGEAVAAIDTVAPEMRAVLAASAFAEIERGRLPGSFLAGFEAVAQAPPDQRSTLAFRAIADNVALFEDACANGGRDVLKALAELAPEQRTPHLNEHCDFVRLGLIDASTAASAEPLALILSHMAFAGLAKAGELDARERALLTAMY